MECGICTHTDDGEGSIVQVNVMAMERHFIQEGVIRSEIENFLKSELNRAGYSSINIQKTPLATRIILYVEKPPIVIGKKGRRINKLTTILTEKYGVDNPVIDVQKITKPTLDPNIIARRIAVALERGMNRRRIAYKAIRAVMSSGARGIEIILSGKLVGKGERESGFFHRYHVSLSYVPLPKAPFFEQVIVFKQSVKSPFLSPILQALLAIIIDGTCVIDECL